MGKKKGDDGGRDGNRDKTVKEINREKRAV